MLLKAPIEAVWSFTSRCNLSCSFCLADSGKHRTDPLDESGKLRILDELIKSRVLKVILTGGEPLADPLVFKIISSLRESGISVELTTNGTLLDADCLDRLKSCGLKNLQISIHGSNSCVNDSLMGKSFAKIKKAITLSVASGIPVHTKTTLTERNIEDIPSLVHLLSSLGVKSVHLDEVVLMGRALKNYRTLKPSLKKLSELADIIDDLEKKNSVEIHFQSFSLELHESGRAAYCTLGDDNSHLCTVSPSGDMYQCTMSAMFGLENNILKKGLIKCWHGLKKYRKFVNPGKLEGSCSACGLKEECGGGCRGLVYGVTQNLWREYDLCPIVQRKKTNENKNMTFDALTKGFTAEIT